MAQMEMQLQNKLLAYTITGPGPSTNSNTSVGQLESVISTAIGILTIIGVIYFVVQIILSGFTMISSQGDPKELETSKKRLTNNVMGLAIIAIAYGLGALLAKLLGLENVFDLTKVLVPIE